MKMPSFIATGILSFFSCLIFSVTDSQATGFAIFAQGGSTFDQADATVAHGEDPSVLFYNPALINQLPGTQMQAGTTLIVPVREFRSSLTGQKTKTESEVFFPSSFYITHAVTDRFSVGLGIFNPFGLGTTWPENWEGRYLATKSTMTTFAFNPVASIKLAPWITVAGGVTYLTLDATFERHVNFGPFGLPDGTQKLHGTGDGFGFNMGLLVEPLKDTSVGLSYRSRIHVPITGDVSFGLPNPALAALFPNTSARTSIDLPPQAYAGIHFRQLYPFTFEISTRWEGWSTFRELSVQLAQPVAGSTVSVTPRNWHDTWAGILGLKYQLNDKVALLGGYQYSNNPVPDNTFEPAIPDSNSHFFSLGTELKLKPLNIVLGYAFQLYEKRTKNNSVTDPVTNDPALAASGDYKSGIHMITASLTYRF
jgi:long-chain fatty acid transport protein